MAKNGKNKNYVSVWFWMFAIFLMALPCIGFVMVIIWAFVGENESRKNYFRALIIWFLILAAIWGSLIAAGLSPLLWQKLLTWLHQIR
jgi:uncharacterized membrane protein YqjE